MSNYSKKRAFPQRNDQIDLNILIALLSTKTGYLPRPNRRSYIALCPAHKDKNPSLTVTEIPDRILMYCFVGCKFKDICSALGLETWQLFCDKWEERHGR